MGEQSDLPLAADVAEINREAQKAVDRVIAARAELAAAITGLNDVRGSIAGGSAAAVNFIDAYMNPVTPNPAPVAPEVAAPSLAAEPPVFTTVDTVALTPETTSGGAAPVVDEAFDVPELPAPVETSIEGEGEGSADGAGETLDDE